MTVVSITSFDAAAKIGLVHATLLNVVWITAVPLMKSIRRKNMM